jgi:hypothetical protein
MLHLMPFSTIANPCNQLPECLYHMMLIVSSLFFNKIQVLTPAELGNIINK